MHKENRLLQIGILGAGPIAQAAHLPDTQKARNAELYAMCDLAEDLLEKVSARHSPQKTFTDYDQMLADPNVEAVIIATSDQFHVPAALKALEAGKHALVEKPLGISIEECQTLAERVKASGLVLQVGHMKRFDPGIAYAHDFIQSQMGEMLALKAWYCDHVYRYSNTDNLQPLMVTSSRAKQPEGNPKADKRKYFILTHGSHLVDTTRYLGGNIEAVRCRRVEKFGAYCWFADVAFTSGAVGHLDLTIGVRMDWHEGFQIYGEFGSVVGKTYNPWYRRSSEVECFSSKTKTFTRPIGEDAGFYKLQIEAFADSILRGQPMRGANVEDGVAAMRAMVALARSAETGEWVTLSSVSGSV
jgi:predicted dehydrogenase